jgi:hypothetical protein
MPSIKIVPELGLIIAINARIRLDWLDPVLPQTATFCGGDLQSGKPRLQAPVLGLGKEGCMNDNHAKRLSVPTADTRWSVHVLGHWYSKSCGVNYI